MKTISSVSQYGQKRLERLKDTTSLNSMALSTIFAPSSDFPEEKTLRCLRSRGQRGAPLMFLQNWNRYTKGDIDITYVRDS